MKLVRHSMNFARHLMKLIYISCVTINFTKVFTNFTNIRTFFDEIGVLPGHKVKGQWLRFQDPESGWFVKYVRAAFFCWYMMDSCTTIRDNQSASSSMQYFLFLPCVGTQVSMQTTGFRTRLLKCIDTWSAEKKIRIYRLIMFHCSTLFRL